MRFLMLNWRDPRNPKSGGAERVSQAYLAGLRKRGHEVFWFANDFPNAEPEEVIGGIHIVRGGGSGGSIFKARQWYQRQKRFDLVIDQHHGIPWFAPWWAKTNCVAYIHEVLGPIWNAFYGWPVSTVGRWQERWTHWFYRDVPFWTPSESTAKALWQTGVRDVTVIPNGVDTSPLATLEPKPLNSPVRLIAVSRLAPNKRVDHVMQAVKCLFQRGVAAHLTIVGAGEDENKLKEMAKQPELKGHVTMTGSIAEAAKNAQLRQAHVLVHTSIREGWGLNVIEANAMSTPATVYPVGGLVDSTVDGQTGIVTREETPEAVADAVAGLVKTPERYEILRKNAWERAMTFQWDVVLPKACDWLEEQARRNTKNQDPSSR